MLTHPYILFSSFKLTIVYKWKEGFKDCNLLLEYEKTILIAIFLYVCGLPGDSMDEQVLAMISSTET